MRKTVSILSASAIVLGTAIPAFATPPDVGGQSGAGSTDMTMVWQNPNAEYGGTEDPNNPNSTGNPGDDGYDATAPGANLAFKAPTAINFVAKANGDLLAPTAAATYIENFSSYGIHVSSMQIEQGSGWNIVADAAAAAGTANAVWGKIGPETEKLDWSGWVGNEKTAVTTPAKWGMSAATASSNVDELHLYTEGKVANLNKDLSSAQTFATIHWYLSNGGAGSRFIDPANRVTITKSEATNGSFKISSSIDGSDELGYAAAGDTVYIVATPASGYNTGTMTVTNTSNDSSVTVTSDSANVGHFTVPANEVNVEVSFTETPLLDIFPLATMQADSNTIRSSTATAEEKTALVNKYLPYAQIGKTADVILGDDSSATVRLVDVSVDRGLVFMFTGPLASRAAHRSSDTNIGGWNDSDIRSSLNGGEIYTTYLQGLRIDGTAVTPAKVSNNSLDYNGGNLRNLSTDEDNNGPDNDGDMFWLASMEEVYGVWGWNYTPTYSNFQGTNGSDVEQCSQFAYFGENGLGVTTSNYNSIRNISTYFWWLRSSSPRDDVRFMLVYGTGWSPNENRGFPTDDFANTPYNIVPCFCL